MCDVSRVFIVLYDHGDEYSIDRVFSTKELAETYIEANGGNKIRLGAPIMTIDERDVEEYTRKDGEPQGSAKSVPSGSCDRRKDAT